MEPPPKRLRILHSVDVDETNPDYVQAKQKQQRRFKGRLESIFAKYEHMHESMSDEIDMKTNKLVVDRGHLRRLNRQVTRNETMLLDNLLERGPELEDDGSERGDQDDTEDELAPSREPTPTVEPTGNVDQELHQMSTGEHAHASSPNNNQLYVQSPNNNQCDVQSPNNLQLDMQSPNNLPSAMLQAGVPQIPNTPNPATNLLQFVHFPQTPEGQQAQHAFYSTLTMTINQAVHQAVAPLFSNMLGHTSNMHTPFAQSLPTPSMPMTIGDTITQARDPKWLFPPLPDRLPNPQAAQSSPIPTLASNSTVLKPSRQPPRKSYKRKQRDEEIPETLPVQASSRKAREPIAQDQHQPSCPRQSSPRVEIRKRRTSISKQYNFTKEDEIHIGQRKTLHQETWTKIRASREKWKDWPLSAFRQYWHDHSKKKPLHLVDLPAMSPATQHDPTPSAQQSKVPPSPATTHDLLTPTSLEYEEDDGRREVPESDSEPEPESEPETTHELQEIPESSNAHYDDDELELLSLAGDELNTELPPVEDDEPLPVEDDEPLPVEDDEPSPAPEDIVLPSIEPTDVTDEHTTIQQQLLSLETSTTANNPHNKLAQPTIPSPKPQPTIPSTSKKRKPPIHLSFHASPSSSPNTTSTTTTPHKNPKIKSEFPSPSPQPSSSSQPLLLLHSTPAATTTLLKTPNSSFSTTMSSSSTVKLSRRQFLKQVKQSWSAKGKGRGRGKGKGRGEDKDKEGKRVRVSLGGVQRRVSLDDGGRMGDGRRQGEGEESEDELAK